MPLSIRPLSHQRRRPHRVPPTARWAVDARDLIKTYPGGRGSPPVTALDGLNLAITGGQVFGLLGPNGAGKSTTVKILSTLSRADSGTALVCGVDVTRSPGEVRSRIGLVSQKSSSDPMGTGRENLVLAGRIQGLSKADARRRAEELLSRFDLTAAADRLAKTYSGGMSRKLDVAIGLVHQPEVLFLDEPTTGLDPQARAEMWNEIGRPRRRRAGHRAAHDALSRRSGPTRRSAGHHRCGPGGRRGTPDELKSELRGDTVQIELAEPSLGGGALALLGAVHGVHSPAIDGKLLRARADSGPRAVPAVLTAPRGPRRDRVVGDGLPSIPRRCLPAARGPAFRGGGMSALTTAPR